MLLAMRLASGSLPFTKDRLDRRSALESLQPWIPQIAIAALAVAIGLTVALTIVALRLNRFARPFETLAEKAREGDIAAALQAQLLAVDDNRKRIEDTLAYVRRLRSQARNAVQAIGFLRYDAFDDIRGNQSYSLCFLDANQDGLILTSSAGRADSRGYAKPVEKGTCHLAMSEEEVEALAAAKKNLQEVDEPVVAGL
jgi:hypothetical protein